MAQDAGEVTQPGRSRETIAITAPSPAPDSAQIRSDMEDTRAEMSETIDAIHERLSPSRLLEQAKDSVKDATLGRLKSLTQRARRQASLFDEDQTLGLRGIPLNVKDNPMSVVLVGMGAMGIIRHFGRRGTGTRPQSRTSHSPDVPQGNTGRGRTSGRPIQFLVAAGACAACWLIWKQTSGAALPEIDYSEVESIEARDPFIVNPL
jgi:hypothetical protein